MRHDVDIDDVIQTPLWEDDEDKKIECWREPTAYEISFGEGAIHYRDFTVFEIGRNRKGELKKWFKADDGLIYHRY